LADLLHDDRTLESGVGRDPAQRLFNGALHDVDADLLVAGELQIIQYLAGANQRDAAAGDDALFDRRLRRVHRVLDARLLLFPLALGRRAALEDRDAADQLREPLLQLFTIVVGRRVLDLRADLLDAAFDGVRHARAFDDGRVVFVDDDFLGLAE